MDKASESILGLKPKTFHYKDDKTNTLCFGLIAEDVAKVDPSLVVMDQEGLPSAVEYHEIPMRLLNEFLKEHKKVEEQQAAIAELKSKVAQQQKGMEVLTAQLREQAAQIQKVSAQLEVSKPAAQVVVNKP
jgi:septal ring factor EnvC (AmiA/AmiB activator)